MHSVPLEPGNRITLVNTALGDLYDGILNSLGRSIIHVGDMHWLGQDLKDFGLVGLSILAKV